MKLIMGRLSGSTLHAKQKEHTAHYIEQFYGNNVKYVVHFCIFVKIVLKNHENIISEI